MIRRIPYYRCLLAVLAFLMGFSSVTVADTVVNSDYRFSITLPQRWFYEENEDGPVILTAWYDSSYLQVTVPAVADSDRLIVKRKIFERNNGLAPSEWKFIRKEIPSPPYDVLRHSMVEYYITPGGGYVKRLIVFRARTLFMVDAYSATEDFSRYDAAFDSVDIDLTTYGCFLLAKSGTGSIGATVLLLLFPFLGFSSRKFRDRWRLSCRSDRSAAMLYIVCIMLTVILFAAEVLALMECPALLCWVVAVSLIFWAAFFSGCKFLRGMYEGLFGQ